MKQKEALDLLKLGHNVFLTGAAGSGKTHLLNEYIAHLRSHGVGVAVTASTGIAATHLGGQTIHSWSGMGVRDALDDDELEQLVGRDRVKRSMRHAKVLIIDEVSMLHAHQLDMVERITRHALDFTKPFGGLQVVLCGDFFQLPPVGKHDAGDGKVRFAYESAAWETGGFQVCYLSEQFRQGNDPLLKVLDDIRRGRAGEHTKKPLRKCYKRSLAGATPTRLFARNINVDAINERALTELDGEVKAFHMQTRGFSALTDTLKRSCLAPETLQLKEGAEVMFVKNSIEGRYVNGTRGRVVGFDKKETWPLVKTLDGRTVTALPEEWRLEEGGAVRATVAQVPLRLAWAITIHKSQGMTLDAAEVDLSDTFEPGMGYVALSRVRSLAGLSLLGLNDTALAVHPKVLAHDARFREWSDSARAVLVASDAGELRAAQEGTLFARFGGVSKEVASVQAKKRSAAKRARAAGVPTHERTRALIEKKLGIANIAKERGLTTGTIIGHLEKLHGAGRLPDIEYLKPPKKDFEAISAAFAQSKDGVLTPIFKKFNGRYPFETLRLVRLWA